MLSACSERLDNDFVRANALHLVEDAFAFAVQIAFDAQHRKLVRDHAQRPTWLVRARAVSIGEHLRRRLGFVPGTEGAEPPRWRRREENRAKNPRVCSARSVEIITQPSVIGSFRNSGIGENHYSDSSGANASRRCSIASPSDRDMTSNRTRAGSAPHRLT